jgi:hypothetical protein
MNGKVSSKFKRGLAPALIGAIVLAALPSAGMAVTNAVFAPMIEQAPRFTPAGVDPDLAERVNSRYAAARKAMRFTPAASRTPADRTVTVAIRLDDETARAISVRSAIAEQSVAGRSSDLSIAPTRFDLGIARGYQSFVKPAAELPVGVSKIEMPDLADFKPRQGTAAAKPSRFQPRIALESESGPGRAPRTLEGAADRTVDVSGAYRLTRNLDVTAGVRLSQDRSRLAPLTNGVEDDQAVYVGTQLRF